MKMIFLCIIIDFQFLFSRKSYIFIGFIQIMKNYSYLYKKIFPVIGNKIRRVAPPCLFSQRNNPYCDLHENSFANLATK